MKKSPLIPATLTTLAVLGICSCTPESETRYEGQRHRFGYQPEEVVPPQDQVPPTPLEPTPTPAPQAPPPPPQVTPTPAQAPVKKDYPYGTPIPGKPGFVTSPYAPYSGYVDVRGFPPGTEVKDPYTDKIFLVP